MRNSNAYPSFQTSMVGLWFGVICVVVFFIFYFLFLIQYLTKTLQNPPLIST